METVAESVLRTIEREHADGISSFDLLEFFAAHGIHFREATLRRWVQVGLLPRSVRVGKKGKHQGSRGKYPVRVVRLILKIKALMARGLTIEEIQNNYLFIRGDIEVLQTSLDRIFSALDDIVDADAAGREVAVRAVKPDIEATRDVAKTLVTRLERIEKRLTPPDQSGAGEEARVS
ncbi:MAG: MerR family transcriptional regulator [Myxococcota bacterium]